MSRKRTVCRRSSLAAAALAFCVASSPVSAETFDWARLSPDVAEFIAGNFLSHAAEFPDAEEPEGALRAYVDGTDRLGAGDVDAAVELFTRAAQAYPGARHAHAGLGAALWERHQLSGSQRDLARAVSAFLAAHRIGLDHDRVRYVDVLAEGLGRLGDSARLRDVFLPLLDRHPDDSRLALLFARGLALAQDAEAEAWFQRSLATMADDPQPAVEYGRFLIDRGRAGDAYDALAPVRGAGFGMAEFLFGYAAEALGRGKEAREAYRNAAEFSRAFPLPASLWSELAAAQGARFASGAHAPAALCNGQLKMSRIIYCESRGEGTGGMRAVGWTLRSRVFRGTEKTGCVVSNSGATLCDKYYTVGTQSGQFCGGTTHDATTDQIALDVYNGRVPDAYNNWCPAGSISGTKCTGTCTSSTTSGANVNGATFFYATSGTCATTHPSGCGSTPQKTCSNGGSDHCFYRVP
jgi:tetratricopeptide (TPR) repeat protein